MRSGRVLSVLVFLAGLWAAACGGVVRTEGAGEGEGVVTGGSGGWSPGSAGGGGSGGRAGGTGGARATGGSGGRAGGTDGAPATGGSGWDCLDNPREPCRDDALIDDGEGQGYICPNDGKVGYWYPATDESGGSMGPSPFEMWDLGGGDHVARIWGDGFNEYVSLAVMVLSCNTADPYDASAYSGIQFQATGPTGITTVTTDDPPEELHWVTVVVWTTDTAAASSGGTCVSSGTQQCDGHYRVDVPLGDGTTWEDVNLAWDDLTQPDWAVPARFDPAHILRIVFRIEFSRGFPGADFDLTIGYLSFY